MLHRDSSVHHPRLSLIAHITAFTDQSKNTLTCPRLPKASFAVALSPSSITTNSVYPNRVIAVTRYPAEVRW